MVYSVSLTTAAQRNFARLTDDIRKRIYPHLMALQHNPRPPGIKALHGVASGLRLRVGDYRVLYVVDDRAKVVTIYKVGHRREVYS